MYSTQEVTTILEKIKEELEQRRYVIPSHLLRLAKKNPEIMSYINGQGGMYYQFLALFTKYFKPKHIVELGSFYGISTVMIYSELGSESELFSVDILKDQRYIPPEIFSDSRVRFVYGDALDLNIYAGNIPQKIDWFYTDTVHFYQQVRDEYDVYEPLLEDGAFILVDDIFVKDKGKLFNELPFEKWDLSSWCHYNGFGLLRYKKQIYEQPLVEASLRSARIGFRKFNNVKQEIEKNWYRRLYDRARDWARRYKNAASVIRLILKPFKKAYTPYDKEY